MFTRTLISLFFLFPLFSVAQVGVGTTSVHASAKLQIESANKGFLQPRVALTGTADNSTIASPATGLMVFNTANAGSGSTAVTQGIYYYTGSAWTRLSDAPTTTFVSGTWAGGYAGGLNAESPNPPPTIFLGQIELPTGRWEIVLNIELGMVRLATHLTPGCDMHLTYWLSSSSNPGNANQWLYPQTLPNITTDVVVGGAASFSQQVPGSTSVTHKGSFLINNTGATGKTYYLFAVESSACGDPGGSWSGNVSAEFNSFGSSIWPQNRFYAVKIN